MAHRTLSNRIGDVVDQINIVQFLNEAITMASSDSALAQNARDALQAVADVIDTKIESIKDQLYEIIEEARC